MAEAEFADKLASQQPSTGGYTAAQIGKLVKATKWANNLSAREIETLSQYLHVRSVEPGAFVVKEGSREAFLCLIVTGQVSIVKDAAGRPAKLGVAGAGRIVGEMSLIDGEPRSASVLADPPTLLVILTAENFARLSDEVPRLAVKVLLKITKLISQRLRQTSGALIDHLGG